MNTTLWKTNATKMTRDEEPVYQILRSRGVTDPDAFLKITKKKMHSPFLMKGVRPAVKKIATAIKRGLRIMVYGDYDADGVSSTSLWVLLLRELDADVSYYVPNRFTDGYGVNNRALEKFANDGYDLVITCDTGITAVEQIAYAKSLGLDIIVTDHHEPQDYDAYDNKARQLGRVVKNDAGDMFLIPDCIVVNPKRPDCQYPFKSLAGVGVSFKILCALCDMIHPLGRVAAYQYMDIVSVGTIADVMDIVDENRVICRLGLDMMSKTKNRGLYQLLKANDLAGKEITSKDIGWTVAPCINAAGRIVSAEQAVDMLISDNKMDAYRYAKQLVDINKERKELTKAYVGSVIDEINARQEKSPTAIIVHYYPAIPEGIIGLVAGRVSNHFYKPAIILSDAEHPGIIKGSGRSIQGFDLFRSLMQYTSLMQNFGGHEMACGLSLEMTNFDKLRDLLEMYADSMLSADALQKKIYIDAHISGEILDLDFVDDLSRLEPFGNGNKQPLFMMTKLNIIQCKAVGDEKNHFWALLSDGKRTFGSIGFFLWEKYEAIGKPKKLDVAFFPARNEYPKGSGKVSVQLLIEDLREAKVSGTKRAKGRKKA